MGKRRSSTIKAPSRTKKRACRRETSFDVNTTSQPSSRTICLTTGTTGVNFSVTATGASSFQWQISTDNITFANVTTGSGGTTNSYTYTATSGESTKYFRVIVSSASCSVTSNVATLTLACFPDLEMTTDSDSPTMAPA